jgi:two-component system, NarL family, invasion response regulator UvrY
MEKILIVDDHNIIRSGVKIMFSGELARFSFDEAADGDTAMKLIEQHNYSMIILDINMPGLSTQQIVQNTLALYPDSKMLIFSMNAENIFAKPFLKMGVKGYVRKDEAADEIRKAIVTVLNNKRYISRELSERFAGELLMKQTDNPFDKLSPKQSEITRFLIEGKGLNEICNKLNLHSSTISTQKTRIFQKLNVKNVVDLYALAKMHMVLSH